jgi:hypothetical protein
MAESFDSILLAHVVEHMTDLGDYSFPFPRIFGHVFRYNEFVSVNIKV